MELLLNELSLTGQFDSVEDFVERGVMNVLQVLHELRDEDQVLKKYDFYNCQVTPQHTIHEVLTGNVSRTHDELRKFKIHLSRVFSDPYWEDDPRQDPISQYLFEAVSVTGTSLAEAYERNQIIISFVHQNFQDSPIPIIKKGNQRMIDNLFEEGQYITFLYTRGLLTTFSLRNKARFARTNHIRQGRVVYREIATNNYWYLDNLHKNHYEVFNANEDHLGIADLAGVLDGSKAENGRKL